MNAKEQLFRKNEAAQKIVADLIDRTYQYVGEALDDSTTQDEAIEIVLDADRLEALVGQNAPRRVIVGMFRAMPYEQQFKFAAQHLFGRAGWNDSLAKTVKADARKSLVAEMVAGVKAHAQKNYEQDGWDIVVETYTDEEIAEVVKWCESVKGAIRKMRSVVGPHAARRAEIQAEVF